MKKIISEIVDELLSCSDDRLRWYEYTLDIINTKRFKEEKKKEKRPPKFIFPMTCRNKGLDAIKLGNFHLEEVRSLLPTLLNEDEILPTIVYSLEGTIRNKVFNYKQTVSEIDSDDLNTVVQVLHPVTVKTRSSVIQTMATLLQEISESLVIKSLENSLLVVLTSEKPKRFTGVIAKPKLHLVWTHIYPRYVY